MTCLNSRVMNTYYYQTNTASFLSSESTSSQVIVTHLKSIFAEHGIPAQLLTDNGLGIHSTAPRNLKISQNPMVLITLPVPPLSTGKRDPLNA